MKADQCVKPSRIKMLPDVERVKAYQKYTSWSRRLLPGLLRIHLLFPRLFNQLIFHAATSGFRDTAPSLRTSHLVFVGNVFLPLFLTFMECKLYAMSTRSMYIQACILKVYYSHKHLSNITVSMTSYVPEWARHPVRLATGLNWNVFIQ